MANLTVMLATYDGAATLPRLLGSLARQRPPTGGWKLVAVDNGGGAAGGAILREWSARLPLTLVTETRRGKSAALNTGLREVAIRSLSEIILESGRLGAFCMSGGSSR